MSAPPRESQEPAEAAGRQNSQCARDPAQDKQDQQALRELLLAGASSPPVLVAGEAYFQNLRDAVRRMTTAVKR